MDVDDMEIDLGGDIDVGVVEDEEEEAMNIEALPPLNGALQVNETSTTNTLTSTPAPSDDQHLAPEKVHIRGLDTLTTDDVRAFALEHFPTAAPLKIEWIDDTSANLVYDTPDSAEVALRNLTNATIPENVSAEPFILRPARAFSSHPGVALHVRLAVNTDVKRLHAREASRFYLLNPDKDPGLKREQQGHRRRKEGKYNNDRRSKRQRDDDEPEPFDVNMYDDDPESLAARKVFAAQRIRRGRRNSMSSFSSDDDIGRKGKRARLRREGRNRDLFARRLGEKNIDGRLRGRSASPLRDGDGRMGFEEDAIQPSRRRSRTPPLLRDMRAANGSNKANAGRELFSSGETAAKELFPSRTSLLKGSGGGGSGLGGGPDLFARINRATTPLAGTNHHRKDAFDAADRTGAAAASASATSSSDLFAHRLERPSALSTGSTSAPPTSLADRITGGPSSVANTSKQHQHQHADTAMNDEEGEGQQLGQAGFSIRGTALRDDEDDDGVKGFNIRGSATGSAASAAARELFPAKARHIPGEDLFSAKLKGRGAGAGRRRAEDMFG